MNLGVKLLMNLKLNWQYIANIVKLWDNDGVNFGKNFMTIFVMISRMRLGGFVLAIDS
jgi:ABC-type uncharacterized transport system permease subunit